VPQGESERIAIVNSADAIQKRVEGTDHIFDFAGMIGKYDIGGAVTPGLRQRSNTTPGKFVIKAKKENKCLCLAS